MERNAPPSRDLIREGEILGERTQRLAGWLKETVEERDRMKDEAKELISSLEYVLDKNLLDNTARDVIRGVIAKTKM